VMSSDATRMRRVRRSGAATSISIAPLAFARQCRAIVNNCN
jgi:hypothetical protein